MTVTQEQSTWFAEAFTTMVDNVDKAVLGKEHIVRLAFTCMLSEGHLLLEDYPGTGKTQLARSMASTVKGTNSRIQFTPDLLPSDVTGVTIYDPSSKTFEFHKGPIFATIVLADEINRASPKTQSALLEVMEEGHVTVDGVTHDVGDPFMVIATQNPIEQAGTYRLPEAQLDRFLMKTSIGYPDEEATVHVLREAKVRDRTRTIGPVVSAEVVAQMAELADEVHVDDAILTYVARIAEESRRHVSIRLGLSVRGCLAFIRCAKTWAISQGRTHVIPDDIKLLAEPVLGHRLILTAEAQFAGLTVEQAIGQVLSSVEPPTERGGNRGPAADAAAPRPSASRIPESVPAPAPGVRAGAAAGASAGASNGRPDADGIDANPSDEAGGDGAPAPAHTPSADSDDDALDATTARSSLFRRGREG